MVDGKRVTCKKYLSWRNMMQRCYSEKYNSKTPAYKECSVCTEWHRFSVFKKWIDTQDWEGKQLDKDLLIPGNKVYGPDTCMFVSSSINSLLVHSRLFSGEYPRGVCFHKSSGRYMAQCFIRGKHRTIGRFSTIAGAEKAYLNAKSSEILRRASGLDDDCDSRLYDALVRHAEILSKKASSL